MATGLRIPEVHRKDSRYMNPLHSAQDFNPEQLGDVGTEWRALLPQANTGCQSLVTTPCGSFGNSVEPGNDLHTLASIDLSLSKPLKTNI